MWVEIYHALKKIKKFFLVWTPIFGNEIVILKILLFFSVKYGKKNKNQNLITVMVFSQFYNP